MDEDYSTRAVKSSEGPRFREDMGERWRNGQPLVFAQRAASEGPRWTRAQEMKEMGSLLDFALLYLFGC